MQNNAAVDLIRPCVAREGGGKQSLTRVGLEVVALFVSARNGLDDLVAPSYLTRVLGPSEALLDIPSAPGVDGPQPQSMNSMRGVCRTLLRERHTFRPTDLGCDQTPSETSLPTAPALKSANCQIVSGCSCEMLNEYVSFGSSTGTLSSTVQNTRPTAFRMSFASRSTGCENGRTHAKSALSPEVNA